MSDLAGMFIAPPLVMLLIGLIVPNVPERIAALTATGLVLMIFTFAKATHAGAQAASAAWSVVNDPSLIRRDPTDLVALPMLLLGLLIWRRARLQPLRTRLVQIVVLPIALLGVMATSPMQYSNANKVYVTDQGVIIAPPLISEDDGATFHLGPYDSRPTPGAKVGATKECVAGTHRCYRIMPGRLGVEQSDDDGATWTVSWEVSERATDELEKQYPDVGGEWGGELASQQLVTHAQGSGHVVVVANGRDGILVRGTDGTWTRLGFGYEAPPPLPAEPTIAKLWSEHILEFSYFGVIALLLMASAACGMALYQSDHRKVAKWLALGMGLGSIVTTCIPGFLQVSMTSGNMPVVAFVPYLATNLAMLMAPLVIAVEKGALIKSNAAIVALLSAGIAMLLYIPGAIVSGGWPYGLAVFAVGLAGMLWYGYRCGKAQSTA